MSEIGEAHKCLPSNAKEVPDDKIGPLGGLQGLAEDRIIETIVLIIAKVRIGVPLNHGQPPRHGSGHIFRVEFQPARVRSALVAQRRHQRAVAAADLQHTRSAEHTSELQSLLRHSYAVYCLQKK